MGMRKELTQSQALFVVCVMLLFVFLIGVSAHYFSHKYILYKEKQMHQLKPATMLQKSIPIYPAERNTQDWIDSTLTEMEKEIKIKTATKYNEKGQ